MQGDGQTLGKETVANFSLIVKFCWKYDFIVIKLHAVCMGFKLFKLKTAYQYSNIVVSNLGYLKAS